MASEPSCSISRPHRGRRIQIFRPFDFEWNHVRLSIPGLPSALSGFKIIHLTDLHLRTRWYPAFDRLLERIASANADLLLFTGDFVDDKRNHLAALPLVRRMAEGLRAKRGCFAILGNHDGDSFGPELESTPVSLLSGRREVLEIRDAAVELIGLPGYLRIDLPEGFAAAQPPLSEDGRTFRIVLSHFPDHILRVAELRAHLFLAGHTHGGQVCLPGGIPIIKHDALPRRFCSGVHRIDRTWLIVNRGFGSTTLPIRIFCPPEVLEIELVAADAVKSL